MSSKESKLQRAKRLGKLVIKPKKVEEPVKPKKKKLVIKEKPVIKPKPEERIKLVIAEADTKKAIKIRKEIKEIKNLIPKSKYKYDLVKAGAEEAGAGAGAGSSATYDRDELEKDLRKLQQKLMLADINIKVGNIVAEDRYAYKTIKLTPAKITYKKIGYQGWEGDYYTFIPSDKQYQGEEKESIQEFLMNTLDIGVIKYYNYK